MKAIGLLLVLIFVVMGFGCIFAACGGATEVITAVGMSTADVVAQWFLIVLTFLCGMLCFAVVPAILEM